MIKKKKKTYLDWTYNARNPLRRFAHRSRFAYSLKITSLSEGDRLLDFGCGDGLFLNQLLQMQQPKSFDVRGFEPFMKEIEDNEVNILTSWLDVEKDVALNGKYDCVTSFEVFEHFSQERQKEALLRISSVLKTNGKLIISVPIEKGLTALIKTAIRRVNHPHNKHLYNLKNALKSLFGRPMPQYRSGEGYLSHLGFYFSDLEETLSRERWTKKRKFYSPLNVLGSNFNSQVFYEYEKNSPKPFESL